MSFVTEERIATALEKIADLMQQEAEERRAQAAHVQQLLEQAAHNADAGNLLDAPRPARRIRRQ